MKHIFIYNPTAGKNNKGAIKTLQEKMKEYDGKLEYEFYPTAAAGDATAYVKSRCEADPVTPMRFYAGGGDGTANEVLHGIVGHENASMTCYPCGSGNDYVKYYGGADRFLDIDALVNAEETPVDIMRVDDRYAINVINFGFDTCVLKTMIKVKNKKIIGGKHAYTTGVVAGLLKGMNNKCTVSVDGERLNNGSLLLCTIANGSYVGGSFCCAPRSKNDDGLLEVCLVRPISRFMFLRLLGPYTNGNHLDDPRFEKIIAYRRGKTVHVEAPKGFAFSLDGEVVEKNDFTVEVIPGGVKFAVPKAPVKEAEPAEKPAEEASEEKEPATV